jgi:hypothetical protein
VQESTNDSHVDQAVIAAAVKMILLNLVVLLKVALHSMQHVAMVVLLQQQHQMQQLMIVVLSPFKFVC